MNRIYIVRIMALCLCCFTPSVYALCTADVDFGTTDPHDEAGSSNPTITGLPLPIENDQAANLYYVKQFIASLVAYSSVGTLTSNPLNVSSAGTEVTANEFRFIDLTINSESAASFLGDDNAGHPFSTKGDEPPLVFARPSAFTEEQVDEADNDDLGITRYFLQTQISKNTNDATETRNDRGTQLLITHNNITNAGSEAFGTVGGAFYRYRDNENLWSKWIRLDNREIDAQFARVDSIKLDDNVISADARTPFSLNAPADSIISSIVTANDAQTNDRDIPLRFAAKGTGVIELGNFTNDQPTGGASEFIYNISLDGSNQVLRTHTNSVPLVLDSNADAIHFSGNDIENVTTLSATNLTATTAATLSSFSFSANSISTNQPLLIDSTGNDVVFANNRLSGIERLEIADTLVFATSQIAANATLFLDSDDGDIVFDSNVTVTASATIDDIVLNDNVITSGSAGRNFGIDAINKLIDFEGSSLYGLADYQVTTLVTQVASGTEIRMYENTIETTNTTLVLNPNTGTVNFDRNVVRDVDSFNVNNMRLRDNRIETTSGRLLLESQTNQIVMNNESVTNVDTVTIDSQMTLSSSNAGGRIETASQRLVFNTIDNAVSVDNQVLSDIRSVLLGNTLTIDESGLSSTGDLTFRSETSNITFSNNEIINVNELRVRNLTISENTIESNNHLTLTALRDVQLESTAANGTIDANGNRLVGIADPTDDQDAATKNYVDSLSLDEFEVGGNINVRNRRIVNLATPTEDGDVLTKGEVDNFGHDITRFGDYRGTNYDMAGNEISGLPEPQEPNHLARLQDLSRYALPTSLLYAIRIRDDGANMEVEMRGFNVADAFRAEGDRATRSSGIYMTTDTSARPWAQFDDDAPSTTITVLEEGYYLFLPVATCQVTSTAEPRSAVVRAATSVQIRTTDGNGINTSYGEFGSNPDPNGNANNYSIGGMNRSRGVIKYSMIAPQGFWLEENDTILLFTLVQNEWCSFILERVSGVRRRA